MPALPIHFVAPPAPFLDRVLLTNDDGIDAPGLEVLEEIANTIAHEVWIVAPECDQSGISHAVSLLSPLRTTVRSSRHGARSYSVSGTPSDCVVVAVRHLMRNAPPDLVLAGVNRGANLGVETSYSGTVGAAMTALLLGHRAIALSQAFKAGDPVRWDNARTHGAAVIRELLAQPWPGDVCISVNFPNTAPEVTRPLTATRQGIGRVADIGVHERTDPRNTPYLWLRFERKARDNPDDSETTVVMSGGISATPLAFERTEDSALTKMRAVLADQYRGTS